MKLYFVGESQLFMYLEMYPPRLIQIHSWDRTVYHTHLRFLKAIRLNRLLFVLGQLGLQQVTFELRNSQFHRTADKSPGTGPNLVNSSNAQFHQALERVIEGMDKYTNFMWGVIWQYR